MLSQVCNLHAYKAYTYLLKHVLVSGIQLSDSVILYMCLFFFKLFSYLGCYIILSYLCYKVSLCWLSILNMAVCTCQ